MWPSREVAVTIGCISTLMTFRLSLTHLNWALTLWQSMPVCIFVISCHMPICKRHGVSALNPFTSSLKTRAHDCCIKLLAGHARLLKLHHWEACSQDYLPDSWQLIDHTQNKLRPACLRCRWFPTRSSSTPMVTHGLRQVANATPQVRLEPLS